MTWNGERSVAGKNCKHGPAPRSRHLLGTARYVADRPSCGRVGKAAFSCRSTLRRLTLTRFAGSAYADSASRTRPSRITRARCSPTPRPPAVRRCWRANRACRLPKCSISRSPSAAGQPVDLGHLPVAAGGDLGVQLVERGEADRPGHQQRIQQLGGAQSLSQASPKAGSTTGAPPASVGPIVLLQQPPQLGQPAGQLVQSAGPAADRRCRARPRTPAAPASSRRTISSRCATAAKSRTVTWSCDLERRQSGGRPRAQPDPVALQGLQRLVGPGRGSGPDCSTNWRRSSTYSEIVAIEAETDTTGTPVCRATRSAVRCRVPVSAVVDGWRRASGAPRPGRSVGVGESSTIAPSILASSRSAVGVYGTSSSKPPVHRSWTSRPLTEHDQRTRTAAQDPLEPFPQRGARRDQRRDSRARRLRSVPSCATLRSVPRRQPSRDPCRSVSPS